jgi:hypothetical protein
MSRIETPMSLGIYVDFGLCSAMYMTLKLYKYLLST